MLREKRRKKKLVKLLKKLIIVLAAAGVVLAAVLTRELWYPRLEGILTKIPAPENTGELAEGHFPLSIEGGARYQLKPMDGSLAIADDSHFFVYGEDGKPIFETQHTFANPVITVGNKKALLYDLGGKSFGLYSKYKNIYSKTTDDPILIARVGGNDTAAVVTKSDKYPSALMVYDSAGNNIFNYRSAARIIDVTFNLDSSGCYITTIGVSEGLIVSKILYYKFDHIDRDGLDNPIPVWETEELDTLALSVRLFGEDKIAVFGDTMFAFYDINGGYIGGYDYKRELVDYSLDGNVAAMVFSNDERRCSVLVSADCVTGTISEKTLDRVALNLQVNGDVIYMQTEYGIEARTAAGDIISETELDTEYESFLRMGKYVYLLGYDEINRIDYN